MPEKSIFASKDSIFDNLFMLCGALFHHAEVAVAYSWVKNQIKYGILLPKLFWPTVRKNCSIDQEKLFEITRTIYSNSEKSEQFW